MAKTHRGRTWNKSLCGYTPSNSNAAANIVTDEDVQFESTEGRQNPEAHVTCKRCQRKMEVK